MFRYSLLLFCLLPLLVQSQSFADPKNDLTLTPIVQPTQPPAVRRNDSVKSCATDLVLQNLIVVLLVLSLILLILCVFCATVMPCVCFCACTGFYWKLRKEEQKRQDIYQEMWEKEFEKRDLKQPERNRTNNK